MDLKFSKPLSLKDVHRALWFTIAVLVGMITFSINIVNSEQLTPRTEAITPVNARFKP